MAKLKIIPTGDGWSKVVPNNGVKLSTGGNAHYNHRRDHIAGRRYNQFQGKRYVTQPKHSNFQNKKYWRGEPLHSKHTKFQKHNTPQHTFSTQHGKPLMNTAINALIPYPIPSHTLSKPTFKQNNSSQYSIIPTNNTHPHQPTYAINAPKQILATEEKMTSNSPHYTPTNNPASPKTQSATPIPYIKYPKPPATLNLNITEPSYAQTLSSPPPPLHTSRNDTNTAQRTHPTQPPHLTPPPPPPRYQLPPWINFVDQNPWSSRINIEQPSKPK